MTKQTKPKAQETYDHLIELIKQEGIKAVEQTLGITHDGPKNLKAIQKLLFDILDLEDCIDTEEEEQWERDNKIIQPIIDQASKNSPPQVTFTDYFQTTKKIAWSLEMTVPHLDHFLKNVKTTTYREEDKGINCALLTHYFGVPREDFEGFTGFDA